ncbi:MAG TPA: hypothetical protein VGG27_02450 [Magnetospirillaceae bacterium]|jgi:hypothetical protein
MARRAGKRASESVAYAGLCRAYGNQRILVFVDPRVANRPGSPSYNAVDVFAPPLILFAASITVLATFGLLDWIICMMVVILFWAFVQPPIVRWRAIRRAKRIAFASLEGFKAVWVLGGFAVALKDFPERNCIAPAGDWRGFASEYLVDPIDSEPAAAKT